LIVSSASSVFYENCDRDKVKFEVRVKKKSKKTDEVEKKLKSVFTFLQLFS